MHPSNLFWQVESPRRGETIVRTGQMQDPVGRIPVERLCCIDVSVSVLCFCFVVMFYCNILVNLYIPAILTTIKLFVIPAYKNMAYRYKTRKCPNLGLAGKIK